MRKLGLALVLLFGVCSYANATLVVIGTADDRTILDYNLDGVGDGLLPQDDGFLRTGFRSFWRSALEFDLNSVTGSVINDADFYIRDSGSSQDGFLNIWGYSGDGTVDIADGSLTTPLITSIEIIQSAGVQDFVIDVTAFLQSLIDTNATHAGILIGSAAVNGGSSDMCSGDNPNHCGGDFPPELVVDFSTAAIPEPSSLMLILIGLAGGLFHRLKK